MPELHVDEYPAASIDVSTCPDLLNAGLSRVVLRETGKAAPMLKKPSPWLVTRHGVRVTRRDHLRAWLHFKRQSLQRRLPPNVVMGCAVLVATVGAVLLAASQKMQAGPRIAIIRAAGGAALGSVVAAPAETYESSRVTIVDGDTFALGFERIRILNIDTPETRSPCCDRELVAGLKAKERLASLLRSGALTVEREGQDRYGRTLARVSVGGRDVGATLIREGFALSYQPGAAARSERIRAWCG
jgi:micrococcal nuclease